MDNRIKLGRYNTLVVDRITDPGIFLVSKEGEAVLLPNIYVTDDMKIGDSLKVFIYTDSEDRPVATTLHPAGVVGDYVALEVVNSNGFGTFLNWGLPKDLIIPKRFGEGYYTVGEKRVVRIVEDVDGDRLYATEKIKEFLDPDVSTLVRNQRVDLMVLKETELGYKVLIDEKYEGLVFHNRVFKTIRVGDKMVGYIDLVRRDGKVDVVLQPIGAKSLKIANEKVLEVLRKNGGKLSFTYKSDAEEIKRVFEVSKKVYKRALTELIEAKLISLNSDSISLIKDT